MSENDNVDRRRFLLFMGGGVVAAGGAVALYLENREKAPSVDVTVVPLEERAKPLGSDLVVERNAVLPLQHVATLTAVMETIYPSGPEGPGAVDVGAFDYVIEQLRRRDMQGARRILMRGAAQANRVSVTRHNAGFLNCDADQRHDVLQAMYDGEGARGAFIPREFVQFMVALTLEGMFTHPVYGGNRDGAGWNLIGYDGACTAPTLKAPL